MDFQKLTKIWCKFVLDEGLIPSPIVRVLKNSGPKERFQDYRKIAGILSDRENFGKVKGDYLSSSDADIIALATDSFKMDTELIKWLKEIDVILNIIKNTDPNTMSDLLIGALTSFIKGCPFIGEGKKQAYLLYSGPLARTRANKYNLPQQVAFEQFLVDQDKYSLGTIRAYKSAITHISKYLNRNLWEITNVQEILSVQKQLESDINYKNIDKEKHAALSNGFNKYCEFLRAI